jgi:hypothetical protein
VPEALRARRATLDHSRAVSQVRGGVGEVCLPDLALIGGLPEAGACTGSRSRHRGQGSADWSLVSSEGSAAGVVDAALRSPGHEAGDTTVTPTLVRRWTRRPRAEHDRAPRGILRRVPRRHDRSATRCNSAVRRRDVRTPTRHASKPSTAGVSGRGAPGEARLALPNVDETAIPRECRVGGCGPWRHWPWATRGPATPKARRARSPRVRRPRRRGWTPGPCSWNSSQGTRSCLTCHRARASPGRRSSCGTATSQAAIAGHRVGALTRQGP